MADMTNVDAGKLRQSASRIGSLATDLSGCVSKINDAIGNLSKNQDKGKDHEKGILS